MFVEPKHKRLQLLTPWLDVVVLIAGITLIGCSTLTTSDNGTSGDGGNRVVEEIQPTEGQNNIDIKGVSKANDIGNRFGDTAEIARSPLFEGPWHELDRESRQFDARGLAVYEMEAQNPEEARVMALDRATREEQIAASKWMAEQGLPIRMIPTESAISRQQEIPYVTGSTETGVQVL